MPDRPSSMHGLEWPKLPPARALAPALPLAGALGGAALARLAYQKLYAPKPAAPEFVGEEINPLIGALTGKQRRLVSRQDLIRGGMFGNPQVARTGERPPGR